jgi:hypothetical protein
MIDYADGESGRTAGRERCSNSPSPLRWDACGKTGGRQSRSSRPARLEQSAYGESACLARRRTAIERRMLFQTADDETDPVTARKCVHRTLRSGECKRTCEQTACRDSRTNASRYSPITRADAMLRWRILLSVWAGLMAGLAVSGQSEETKPASDLPQLAKQVQILAGRRLPLPGRSL